jgi:hypothetical protein
MEATNNEYIGTISAKIIRKDGTVEDLGEISRQTFAGKAADRIKKLFERK